MKKSNIFLFNFIMTRRRSSWVKNGDAKCKVKGSISYEDCVIELEWISSDSGSLDSGIVTVLNSDGATTIVSGLSAKETMILCCIFHDT